MKTILLSFALLFSSFVFSQEVLTPLPKEEIVNLFNNITGVEITFFESSSSVSMEGTPNCGFFPASLDTLAPTSLNAKTHAYMMIMVNGEFYMDAQLSWIDSNPYLALTKEGKKYYNRLSEQGVGIFKQLLNN